jgi:hypothetical protein
VKKENFKQEIFPGFEQKKSALKTNAFLPCNLLRDIL